MASYFLSGENRFLFQGRDPHTYIFYFQNKIDQSEACIVWNFRKTEHFAKMLASDLSISYEKQRKIYVISLPKYPKKGFFGFFSVLSIFENGCNRSITEWWDLFKYRSVVSRLKELIDLRKIETVIMDKDVVLFKH